MAEQYHDEEHLPEEELEEVGYEVTPTEFLAYVNSLSLGKIPSGKLALGVLLAAQLRHSLLAKRFPEVATFYKDLIAVTKSLTRKPERSLLEALTERYMQPVYLPPAPQLQAQEQPAHERRGLLSRLSEALGLG